MRKLLRSVAAILGALFLMTLVVEPLEFLLVTWAHGSVTDDPVVYFAVRNRPWLLALKFLYNGAAGWLGGYVAAWLAGRAELRHALVLALVQAAGMIWGMIASEYAGTAPRWAWLGFLAVMTPAILWGGVWRARRQAVRALAATNQPVA
jgi:hypothetical protein